MKDIVDRNSVRIDIGDMLLDVSNGKKYQVHDIRESIFKLNKHLTRDIAIVCHRLNYPEGKRLTVFYRDTLSNIEVVVDSVEFLDRIPI